MQNVSVISALKKNKHKKRKNVTVVEKRICGQGRLTETPK